MDRREVCLLLVMASAGATACHHTGRVDSSSDSGSTTTGNAMGTATATATAAAVTEAPHCKADGLGAARLVTAWKPPEGCHWRGLAHGATVIMHNEADLVAGALDCPASGVDFTKNDVVVAGRALSPATVGVDVYDDGKKVTFVSRQRGPCPKEYPPMPITIAVAFLIPAGETRTFDEATCKQAWKCP